MPRFQKKIDFKEQGKKLNRSLPPFHFVAGFAVDGTGAAALIRRCAENVRATKS